MENSIRHNGIVESIEGGHVRVRITQTAACSACKMASHCNAAEAKEKMVDVYNYTRGQLAKGDSVVVSTTGAMAGKALLLGFGLPLILLLVVLTVLLATKHDEVTSAAIALGVLIPYYICIWLCRKRLAQNIVFRIEEAN